MLTIDKIIDLMVGMGYKYIPTNGDTFNASMKFMRYEGIHAVVQSAQNTVNLSVKIGEFILTTGEVALSNIKSKEQNMLEIMDNIHKGSLK